MENQNADYLAVLDGVCFDGEVHTVDDVKIFGIHNMYNISAAYAICSDLGISWDDFKSAVSTYSPLPHRLELFAEIDGVKYFDDSISTIPETAIKALSSVKNVGTILLGGNTTPEISDIGQDAMQGSQKYPSGNLGLANPCSSQCILMAR